MRPLGSPELGEALDKVADQIPDLVLQYVRRFPGCRWERAVQAVTSITAPPLEPADAHELADGATHWFLRRSDLYVARGRRLWPMPSTLIWSERGAKFRATLVGAASIQVLARLASATSSELNGARIPRSDGPGAIGAHHWIVVSPSQVDLVKRHAVDLGFENVDLESVFHHLPRIADLLRPATGNLESTDIPSAQWEMYKPGEGWLPTDSLIRNRSSVLLRSGTDTDGRRSYRYFAHASDGHLVEIDWGEASLWQFLSDAESGYTNALLAGEDLLVEHRLPPTTALWMTGLGCWPGGLNREAWMFSYRIPVSLQAEILPHLEETLGLDPDVGGLPS